MEILWFFIIVAKLLFQKRREKSHCHHTNDIVISPALVLKDKLTKKTIIHLKHVKYHLIIILICISFIINKLYFLQICLLSRFRCLFIPLVPWPTWCSLGIVKIFVIKFNPLPVIFDGNIFLVCFTVCFLFILWTSHGFSRKETAHFFLPGVLMVRVKMMLRPHSG